MMHKTFRLDDIFEKIKTKTLPYKVQQLPKASNGTYNLPALTAGVENHGLSCFVPSENATILKDCISVSANGENSGAMFYQPNDFTILQDAYAIRYKGTEKIGEKEYLYLIAVMQKSIKGNFDWSTKAGWDRIKSIEIDLPITKNEKIDFEYMKARIRELEEARIRELEEALRVMGLHDTKLTKDEEKALYDTPPTKSFRLQDLFDVEREWVYGKNKQWQTRFDECKADAIPVISGVTVNNGVRYYTADVPNEDELFSDNLTITTRGEYSGTVKYHDGNFVLANNILVMQMPDWSKEAKLYIATLISKLGYGGYSGYPRKETLKDDIVDLPITVGGEINFEYMENYIIAISKLTIQKVFDNAGINISLTKSLVNDTNNNPSFYTGTTSTKTTSTHTNGGIGSETFQMTGGDD